MAATSWLDIAPDSPFSIENIPFGIVSELSNPSVRTPAVAVGDYCISLKNLAEGHAFSELPAIQTHLEVFTQAETLNAFATLGRRLHQSVRLYIRELFLKTTKFPHLLKDNANLRDVAIHKLSDCTVHLPMRIGDYTDFYAGLNHAYNVGVLFRGPQNALQPNYMHLPVGYHGRASTIRPSGHTIRRPRGQILAKPGATEPIFAPCRKLDFELELAAFICKGNGPDGEPIPLEEAEDYIFGYVLMNDWSARDIQAFEYVPLGPFNSKNFGTTISPFVVLSDALEPFRCNSMLKSPVDGGSVSDRPLVSYLKEDPAKKTQYNIQLHIDLKPASKGDANDKENKVWHHISTSNSGYLLYSFPQMLTHHTITGCEMNTGDLLASGTISGPSREGMGSLLEMTENGKMSLKLSESPDGPTVERMFLEDGDEVRISGFAGEKGSYVGFGECCGTIVA